MKSKALVPLSNTAIVTEELDELLKNFKPETRDEITTATREFLAARTQAGMFYLEMGKHLDSVRALLEPKGKFLDYLRLLPHLSQATAYRMIWAYQNAQQVLPAATLEVAMQGGYKLISREKGGMFSDAYEDAVKTVTKEIGPPPEKDRTKALEWLQAVLKEKRRLAAKSKPEAPTPDELTVQCLRSFEYALRRTPDDDRRDFAGRVLGMMLNIADFPRTSLKVLPVPKALQAA